MIRIFITAILHLISSFSQAQENTINTSDQVVIEERFIDQTDSGFAVEGVIANMELQAHLFESDMEGRFKWKGKLNEHNYQMYGNGFAYNGVVFQGNDLRFDPLKFDVKDKDLTFEIGF